MDSYEGEKMKYIVGFEGMYSITTHGRVWHHRLNRWMHQWTDPKGYSRVSFTVNKKEYNPRVHRLVALAFVPNKLDKKQVNHKNGNKQYCYYKNLEWVTPRENIQHACDFGLNSHFKLSKKDKIAICQMYERCDVTKSYISRLYNLTPAGIDYIIKVYGNQVGHT